MDVLTVVVVMLYWLWCVRMRENTRGLDLGVATQGTASWRAPPLESPDSTIHLNGA